MKPQEIVDSLLKNNPTLPMSELHAKAVEECMAANITRRQQIAWVKARITLLRNRQTGTIIAPVEISGDGSTMMTPAKVQTGKVKLAGRRRKSRTVHIQDRPVYSMRESLRIERARVAERLDVLDQLLTFYS